VRRLLSGLAGVAVAVIAATASAATSPGAVRATPIGRLPFPERGFVLSLPNGTAVDRARIRVTENGAPVTRLSLQLLARSGVRHGVVLAIDASDSMAGAPFASALDAARSFVAHQTEGERIGLLAFNGSLRVLNRPTPDGEALRKTLANPPALAYGTHITDALDESLTLLAREKIGAGAIVLLSDGADVGSHASLPEVVAKARAQHVRIFTVGLRSSSFDRTTLRAIATASGGSYVEAASANELKAIYSTLGRRFATEYALQYRSIVLPSKQVSVAISVAGVGTTELSYTTPTPSGLSPFHRSLLSRFVLSWVSLALLSVLVAALAGWVLHVLVDRRRPRLVERVIAFTGGPVVGASRQVRQRPRARAAAAGSQQIRSWFGRLEQDLEVARIDMSAARVVALTSLPTVIVGLLLALVSPVFFLLCLLVPLAARAVISRKVRLVRNEFADQLAPNLQVMASAMRAGHSFLGALAGAVQYADEPSRQELARVVADERLGMTTDEALRGVARRMESRDLDQVALVAELARTTGGNAAELLDSVVESIRERSDVRRLVDTLTVQGRMARWILTALPVATGLAFYALQPGVVGPMVHSAVGQVLLVVAAGMVVTGSVVIQRMVDINV
jgi:tight adherence protein B